MHVSDLKSSFRNEMVIQSKAMVYDDTQQPAVYDSESDYSDEDMSDLSEDEEEESMDEEKVSNSLYSLTLISKLFQHTERKAVILQSYICLVGIDLE